MKNLNDKIGHIKVGNVSLCVDITEKIFNTKKEIFYHSCELSNLNKLSELNNRKTISCFNKFKGTSIFSGADFNELDFPCVCVLNGNVSFKASEDIYTSFDKSGSRWILVNNLNHNKENNYIYSFILKMSDLIKNELSKNLLSKYFIDLSEIGEKTNIDIIKYIIKIHKQISLKYMNIFKFRFEKLGNLLTGSYNELLGYNFTINKIYVEDYIFLEYAQYFLEIDHLLIEYINNKIDKDYTEECILLLNNLKDKYAELKYLEIREENYIIKTLNSKI